MQEGGGQGDPNAGAASESPSECPTATPGKGGPVGEGVGPGVIPDTVPQAAPHSPASVQTRLLYIRVVGEHNPIPPSDTSRHQIRGLMQWPCT
eukprot:7342918-Pyramimonas_sp.AAC.1